MVIYIILKRLPAESTAYRLAKHDKEQYPNIITASEEGHTPYYTNSSHLPVSFTSIFIKLLMFKMVCKPSTHPEQFSMHSWDKNSLLGNLA